MSLVELAHARRTHKAFGPEPVSREILLELLGVARLAPNHHLTEPWRFRVLGPDALAALKECAGASEAAKLERAPTLVVASAALSGELLQDGTTVVHLRRDPVASLVLASRPARAGIVAADLLALVADGLVHGLTLPVAALHFGAPEREPAPRERKSAELYVEFLP